MDPDPVHLRKNFLDIFRVGQRTEELVAGAPGPDPRGSWSRSVALRFPPIFYTTKPDRRDKEVTKKPNSKRLAFKFFIGFSLISLAYGFLSLSPRFLFAKYLTKVLVFSRDF